MINSYNNFVSTLKLVRKHRPFAENDNLPKICQPEDHIEVSSPRSSSSEKESEAFLDTNQEGKKDAIKTVNNQGDQGVAELLSDDENMPMASRPEMGPNCNLKSIFSDSEAGKSSKNGAVRCNNQDRFQRLSTMAEERKVNLFYLKDTILNRDATMHDKLDAMT
jgi:hypothetical protein